MTQDQLASALGITFQAVSKWENGISSPDISTLPLLADLFGVSAGVLLGREDEPLVNNDPELTEYLEVLRDRPEMRMLFSITKGAAKEDVEAAVKIIEALRGRNENT